MKLKDARQIVKLLSDEWDLGKRAAGGQKNVCAWIYFCEIMEQSEKIILEKRENKVIGICGYEKYGSKKYRVRKKFYKVLKNILLNSNLLESKSAMLDYLNNYDYTPKKLENYFDGEISILIVDKMYRKLGIGKKLIEDVFNYAKGDNVKNLQILSDESCNFKFYELIGCNKVYEKLIKNGEPNKVGASYSEVGYIYEKKLIDVSIK